METEHPEFAPVAGEPNLSGLGWSFGGTRSQPGDGGWWLSLLGYSFEQEPSRHEREPDPS